MSVSDTGRTVARANEYGRIYSNARTSKCSLEMIEDEEQNAEQEVKKEEKKEESPTNLANEYLALYQKTDAAPEEWKEMHRRLADYFQQIR